MEHSGSGRARPSGEGGRAPTIAPDGSDRARPHAERHDATFEVEVVVPVHNEAAGLEASITTLRRYLDESFPFRTLVTIADNGSTDGTALVAQRLASTLDGVAALMLTRKGRGYALRTAWSASQADVVAYMDVDLSTSLSALLPLVGSVALRPQRPRGGHPAGPGVAGRARTQA